MAAPAASAAPTDVKAAVGSGLLSFPVTCFDAEGGFDAARQERLVDAAAAPRPAALFAAGGTGELFSLTPAEHPAVIRASVAAAAGRTPILAGVGYGTRIAVEMARAAEAAGAVGLLVLPPYLIAAEQEGLRRHVQAICDAVGIGVIVYNRDNAVLQPDTLARLCESCPNLIGFKDGVGDVELVTRMTALLGDRLVYVGGMPTHEAYAAPFFAAGVTTYSSAVYNFIPKQALAFYAAVRAGDDAVRLDLLRRFFIPYVELRNRSRGYAVSIVKAGLRVMGFDPGPVRAPLTDLTAEEHDRLRAIIDAAFGAEAG